MNPPGLVNVPSVDVEPAFYKGLDYLFHNYPTLLFILKSAAGYLIGLCIVLSIFFLIVIIYCVERLKVLRKKENEIYENPVVPAFEVSQAGDAALGHRWETVKDHIDSDNPNDWRQAIIDADIILDDLLSKLGYQGDSIGEKLKRAHTGDFVTLHDAWEAHKVRNQIAHEGTHFALNHHEAKRTIEHYRRVFDEFYYI